MSGQMSMAHRISDAMDRFDEIFAMNLRLTPQQFYVAHSGGKDSVVVHELAKMYFQESPRVVHTPKVSGFNKVHPDTIDFLYGIAAEFGMDMVPGTKMRAFLEQNRLLVQVDGTRRDEADRTDRSSNVIVDGKDVSRTEMNWYTNDGLFGQICLFPIYDWSDEDVWTFIKQAEIAVSPEYNLGASH